MSVFGTKEEVAERLNGLKRYNEWEKANPVELTPAQALAAVSSLYRLMTPEARQRCDDPTYRGVRKMNAALARLRG
jgi:hypothetical protein